MKKTAFFSKTKPSGWWLALLLLSCFDLNAQCNPDILPPNAVCRSAWTVQTNQHGPNMTRIDAVALNNNSTDNCSLPASLTFRATLDPANTVPSTTSVFLNGINAFTIYLWVGDQAGNWSRCAVQVATIAPVCTPDVTPPTCTPDPNVTISRTAYDSLQINFSNFFDAKTKIHAAFGTPQHWDNCDNGSDELQESYYLYNLVDGRLHYFERRFYVRDNVGNFVRKTQRITLGTSFIPDYIIHVPAWRYPESTTTDSARVAGPFYIVPYNEFDSVYAAPCPGGYAKIDREWVVVNWKDSLGNETVLPALDINNDGTQPR